MISVNGAIIGVAILNGSMFKAFRLLAASQYHLQHRIFIFRILMKWSCIRISYLLGNIIVPPLTWLQKLQLSAKRINILAQRNAAKNINVSAQARSAKTIDLNAQIESAKMLDVDSQRGNAKVFL